MYKLSAAKTWGSIKPQHALIALIIINMLIAVCFANNFGEGWDENTYYRYGERSLEAYIRGVSGLELIPKRHIFFSNLRYYGPFYAVAGKITVNILSLLIKNWSYADIWHLVNFIFFQGALISLYILAKRFMRPWTAFICVFLFATQPLIFGHSFINPKDIPFMTFFLASITSGLIMIDAQVKKIKSGKFDYSNNELLNTSQHYSLTVAILFGLLIFSIVGKDIIASLIGSLISFFYYSSPASIWNRLFSLIASQSNQLPVENYIHKIVNSKIEQVAIIMTLSFTIAKPIISEYRQNPKKFSILKSAFNFDVHSISRTLIAGILLGLTTSIRVLGPFAGLLITIQLLVLAKKKSIPNIIYYFSISALTTYLTWPFLWDKPTYHFIEALEVMKNFPLGTSVRFMGQNFASGSLPWAYIPTLIIIQLTEATIILFIIGFISSLWNFKNNPANNKGIFIIYSWFMIPIGMFIILHSSAYDNFRQFLFVLPPIFILSGIALDGILKFVKHELAKIILITAILLPGIIGISSLHPYEYAYYNSFAGGLPGAAKNFETDYWLTAYREATTYLNTNAPINARVLVWGARYNVEHNARNDLQVYGFSSESQIQEMYDYVVVTTRFDANLSIFPTAEIVFEVRKNGVLLAVVKKLEDK